MSLAVYDDGFDDRMRGPSLTIWLIAGVVAVFVIWAADGIFPMARTADKEDEVDEERRLLYVAMTRARDQLYVTYPLHSYPSRTGADFAFGQLSRFLDPGVRSTMQRVTLGSDAAPALPAPRNEPAIDLRSLLRGRFGNS